MINNGRVGDLENEAIVLRRLAHPNCVRLFTTFTQSDDVSKQARARAHTQSTWLALSRLNLN